MGVVRGTPRGNTDHLEQFANTIIGVPTTGFAMNPDWLSDLFTDGAHRVEGVHRPLEHHRDVPPPVRTHTAVTTGKDVDPVEQHLP